MKKAFISGRLGHSPKLRTLPSGEHVLNLSVAVDDPKKVDGQWTKEAMWFDVTMFGRRCASLEPMLQQGTVIVAEGTLGLRSFVARDGTPQTRLEIVATDIDPVSNLRPKEEYAGRSNARHPPARARRPDDRAPDHDDLGDDVDGIPF